ncbi:MAG: META domain-containing protein [Chromatiales bacterium]|jgi:heat shock protein HslJ
MYFRMMPLLMALLLLCLSAVAVASTDSTAKNTSELAGTGWQLVKIMSMDDSVYQPDDRSGYRVEFLEDGSVAILADCNRGKGSWTSESQGRLEFGPIASTKALCPPGSLSERYLAQFQWVRSYVIKESHLFLATKADGSIIEFRPLDVPVVATVFGEEIRTDDSAEMQQIILTRLFDRYAAEHSLKATDEEIETWIARMQEAMDADGFNAVNELTPEEAAEFQSMRREMARSLIDHWKLGRALYEQYGGRIIYQQLGPEPLDAYREFLQEQQKAGAFDIEVLEYEADFWDYFINDTMHDFMEEGSEDAASAFEVEPWERLGSSEVSES